MQSSLPLAPVSNRPSARANSRAPTCIPSTLEEAIDSVRRSKRASGARAGRARSFNARIEALASETVPAT